MSSGEARWIEAVRRLAARGPGAVRVGIGDDCAVLQLKPGEELVVTTDFSLEGVHFRRDWHSPESVGHRCLARGLSDVAAMGARPVAGLLSIALPPELAGGWGKRFLRGLLALASEHKVALAGGDTAEAFAVRGASLLAADIVVLGAVEAGRALLRSGAGPGDVLYVTGSLGASAAELAELARDPARSLRLRTAGHGHPHLFPEPRLAVGRRLLGLATAAMDVSDGLSTDLERLCAASRVDAEVDAAALPNGGRTLDDALHGGEDYELLFTAPSSARVPRRISGVPVTAIGRVLKRKGRQSRVSLVGEHGRRTSLKPGGWQHLSQSGR